VLSRRTRPSAYDEARFLAAAADVEQLDPGLATELLMELSNWRSEALDLEGAMELVPRLEKVARRAGGPVRARGLGEVAVTYILAGEPERFADVFAELRDHSGVLAGIAVDLIWAEQYDVVRHALEADRRDARSSGNRIRRVWIDACLAHLELHLGRLPQARIAAARAITLAEAHSATRWRSMAQSALAGVDAWQGVAEGCRRAAAEAIAVAGEARLAWIEFAAKRSLALLALVQGRAEEAIAELAAPAHRWRESTLVDPGVVAFVPDLVEAYALVGERAAAEAWLERFRAAAERAQRRWARAAVARCEGLLAEQTAFRVPFERSLALLTPSPLALDRARTQLAYGERLRRAGLRREARLQLRAAHEAFAAAEAAPWAERAAAELRATGESVGPRTPDRRSLLTPQELQIAHLVAEGKTNKEVAAQLYLSPKTIEYHLGNTYRKLDVHSRAELARIVTRADVADVDGVSEAATGSLANAYALPE
jgi:DNA-binding CsgD family transcriptional regulator